MAREYQLFPSPARAAYLGRDALDPISRMTYAAKVYSATNKPAAWEAHTTGVTNYLAFESDGTSHLLFESDGTSVLLLESSSPSIQSVIYLFKDYSPTFISGVSSGKSSGTDLANLSLVFPKNYFDAGNQLTWTFTGAFTSNLANTYVTFTITFPDSGSASTVSTPSTITQDALGGFELVVHTFFGFNTSNQGVVTNTGTLTVANTDETNGTSVVPVTAVENTFAYEDVLYYLPQVQWSSALSGNSVSFYAAVLTVT